MPRSDKDADSDKQKRQADQIDASYEKRGVGRKEAGKRAWRTVKARSGGGNESGSGRKTDRSAAAKKSWQARASAPRRSSYFGRRSRISTARSTARSSLWARRPMRSTSRPPAVPR
ncbi:MAG: plasmid stabilization protein [Pseudomonadota bacterium]|nr:plasmid stabilization protein [Pseudomonadota bacterium]